MKELLDGFVKVEAPALSWLEPSPVAGDVSLLTDRRRAPSLRWHGVPDQPIVEAWLFWQARCVHALAMGSRGVRWVQTVEAAAETINVERTSRPVFTRDDLRRFGFQHVGAKGPVVADADLIEYWQGPLRVGWRLAPRVG